MLPNCFGLDGLGMFARRFKSCDTSGDKALSWTEIQACSDVCGRNWSDCPTRTDFSMMDSNKDKVLTFQEYVSYMRN